MIPIGGGGLIGGMAIALRQLRPGVRIVGVEPEGAPTLTRALANGGPVPLEHVSTIADGLSAPFAGALTYELVRDLVDDVVIVSDEEILRRCGCSPCARRSWPSRQQQRASPRCSPGASRRPRGPSWS